MAINRPGAAQCESCKVITLYRDLDEHRVAGYKRLRRLCQGCADRLCSLGLVKL